MGLAPGQRFGSYEVVAPIGAGGMGEVYRARDAKLNRDVALKILPDAFLEDRDRLARFEREAQILAALNHPHIAGIYGFEESQGSRFLVLEMVEGESLAEHIAHSPKGLALDEALAIARQIADALAAAHDKGIIHRDLKPANIMLTGDGRVKVLDFGLAKDLGAAQSTSSASLSPTMTFAATQAGMILGTAAYMAPEQARGRATDKRTDVWAFGCVLYEMLTGRKAFDGEDVTDIIAAVVRAEPDWNALPAATPDHIRGLIRRCIAKDRKQRIGDIAVAQYVMDEAPVARAESTAAAPHKARGIAPGVAIAGALAIAIVVAAATWLMMRPAAERPAPVARFALTPSGTAQLLFSPGATDRDIGISPDGKYITYRAGTTAGQVAIRRIDQLEPQIVSGTANIRTPFFSGDGQWVGFFDGASIKKVSVTGGPAIQLCRLSGANPRGASWGDDNMIYFATADTTTGILSVPSGGGEPSVLTKPDAGKHEIDHFMPHALPAGRGVLFTITHGQLDNAEVAVLDQKTGERRILIRGGSAAQYLPPGYLVYAAAGTLRAVRFDLSRLEVIGDPIPVLEHLMVSNFGEANYTISKNGTLVYVPGSAANLVTTRRLVWVDRAGHEEVLAAPPRPYAMARISPDGTRIAMELRDQEGDIWIWNIARQTSTRLTFDPAQEQHPVWTPDSRRVIFASGRDGAPNLFWHFADGTGTDQRITTSPNTQAPQSITSDGKYILGFEVMPKTIPDVVRWPIEGGPAEPIVQTTFAEFDAEISPDGRYIAYQSNESGVFEIYVRPYPNANGGRWQISTAGGLRPLWARSGRELFFADPANTLMSVPVETSGGTFSAGSPVKVFDRKYAMPTAFRPYDVSADGKRFLMLKEGDNDDKTSSPAGMIVVENWFEELRSRVPAR